MAKQSVWRGAGRLLRVLPHLAGGLWVAYARIPKLTPEARRARVQLWQAQLLEKCGLTLVVRGTPYAGQGSLLVANHISWIDISALHAAVFCRFVSKQEVQKWPVVGRLADTAHTLYLERGSRQAAHRMNAAIAERLQAGDRVAIFPEGTTSDGYHLLPFYANLFQSAIDADAAVQPVALWFTDAQGNWSTTPGYVGDDSLVASVWRTLCADGLQVHVAFGELQYAQNRNRREWADAVRDTIIQMRTASE